MLADDNDNLKNLSKTDINVNISGCEWDFKSSKGTKHETDSYQVGLSWSWQTSESNNRVKYIQIENFIRIDGEHMYPRSEIILKICPKRGERALCNMNYWIHLNFILNQPE